MPEISDAMLAELRRLAAAEGLELPAEFANAWGSSTVPVCLRGQLSRVARDTAANLVGAPLYRVGDWLVTIDPSGETRIMEPDRFSTWAEGWVVFFKKKHESGDPIPETPARETCKRILASDDFLAKIPVVERINRVRMPVRTDDGGVALLPEGYSAEHRTFTAAGGPDFSTDMPVTDAARFLRDLLGDFPWGDGERSLAVQVAAMMGTFCAGLFRPNCLKPMIYYNANMEGSGKSLLAKLAISAVHRHASTSEFSRTEELQKMLDAKAQAFEPYVFLDDVGGGVFSNTLNRFVTSTHWSGRKLGTREVFEVPKVAQVFMTSNGATLSPDLARRSLIADLFSEEPSSERKPRYVMDDRWLEDAENRGRILAALWAGVREWAESGCPLNPRGIASFEEWTKTISAIVQCLTFDDPLQRPNLEDVADKRDAQWRKLVAEAVAMMGDDEERVFSIPELLGIARTHGLFVEKIHDAPTIFRELDERNRFKPPAAPPGVMEAELSEEERDADRWRQAHEWSDRSISTAFGAILRRFRGWTFPGPNGGRYRFGDRNARAGTWRVARL